MARLKAQYSKSEPTAEIWVQEKAGFWLQQRGLRFAAAGLGVVLVVLVTLRFVLCGVFPVVWFLCPVCCFLFAGFCLPFTLLFVVSFVVSRN